MAINYLFPNRFPPLPYPLVPNFYTYQLVFIIYVEDYFRSVTIAINKVQSRIHLSGIKPLFTGCAIQGPHAALFRAHASSHILFAKLRFDLTFTCESFDYTNRI